MIIALAGDTMLGRGVAQRLAAGAAVQELVSPELAELCRGADLTLLNLECCISERGAPWPAPGKPFFFRAPPRAVELLTHLGVDAVTLANNHALDYGHPALEDTLIHLAAAGIATVGAGRDLAEARRPARLMADGQPVTLVGVTDHPLDFAAGEQRPGVALVDLADGPPDWLLAAAAAGRQRGDLVIVTPHWGPNMTSEPSRQIRRAAVELRSAGAGLVAGHSAHVFHGVGDRVLFDLGDFLDDYAVDPGLRNDLGLLWLVTVEDGIATGLEAVPLRLEFVHTRLANPEESAWIARRFRDACAAMETDVEEVDGRLRVRWSPG